MTLDTVSAEKTYFRDERRPWIVDRSDGIVINYRVSSPINRTEVEPYFESSYPFYLLRPKPKSGGGASLKPNRPRIPLTTVRRRTETHSWISRSPRIIESSTNQLNQSIFHPSPPPPRPLAAAPPARVRHDGGQPAGAAAGAGGRRG